MIEFEFVEKLIRALDDSTLDSLEIERGGTRIRLAKTPEGGAMMPPMAWPPAPPAVQPPPAAAPPVPAATATTGAAAGPAEAAGPDPSWIDITSPMVGTFYRAPSPDSPPFAEVGGRVTLGDTLCIIEAMKLMNELEAEVEGTVREVLVQNGEPVEFGQVLFRVEPG